MTLGGMLEMESICAVLLRRTTVDCRLRRVALFVHGILGIVYPLGLVALTLAPVLTSTNGDNLVFTVASINVEKYGHTKLVGNLARLWRVESEDIDVLVFQI